MASQELDAVVGMLRAGRFWRRDLTLQERRAQLDQAPGLLPPVEGVAAEAATVAGLPAMWFGAPGAAREPAVLYLHGGAYQLGSVPSHGRLASALALAAGASALVVEYRLAPEHPHPAAVEDAVAAWRWLLDQGHDPARLAVAGDSAGGGLTIAALVAARDAGLPLPAAAVALSPWVDLEGLGESVRTRAALDPMLDPAGMPRESAPYLGGHRPP